MKNRLICIVVIISMIASMALLLIGCQNVPEEQTFAETYITLSINPELDLATDEEGNVSAVYAVNEDAEILISALELIGLKLDEAVLIVVESAVEAGYISETAKEISLSVLAGNENIGLEMRNYISDKVRSNLSNRGIDASIVEADLTAYQTKASELGVTAAKARIIERALEIDPLVDVEELKHMEFNELSNKMDEQIRNKAVNASIRSQFAEERQLAIDNSNISLIRQEMAVILEALEDETLTEQERTELEAALAEKQTEFDNALAELKNAVQAMAQSYKDNAQAIAQQQRALVQERIKAIRENKDVVEETEQIKEDLEEAKRQIENVKDIIGKLIP